ncbi:amidase [Paenarthrobacter sp. PH39-S1]|uniref:amidase n=1 Tax=Paenarthrobacter sp. PH39-S1 TaxID=3046204 RepID=UPI0024BA0617|nr:amidase [Paenarthrobacter sp. PH39-S1]MDJ0358256.1 amidase [Paenarthrobacter sp. PH39-S1]
MSKTRGVRMRRSFKPKCMGDNAMDLSKSFPLVATAARLKDGRMSAVQCVRSALDRIEEVDGAVKAWVLVDAEGALAEATRLDALPAADRLPLHGIPVGVKDIIDVRGMPTRCGSSTREGCAVAATDAAVVRLLRGLGAIVLGKTVTTEFAYFSPGPTGNPHDPSRTPGGSSSGSAAAVAAGMVPLALGTQTAASVARPASYCGVTGYVSARGAFDDSGITGLSPSLDTLGFIAPTVGDMDFLRRVLGAAHEPAQQRPRFVVWHPEPSFGVDPAMLAALDSAVGLLAAASVVEPAGSCWPVPDAGNGEHITASALAGAHATIMAHEAVRLRATEANQPTGLGIQLRALFDEGRAVGEQEHARALELAGRGGRALRSVLHGSSVLLCPAAQAVAPEGLDATGSPLLSRPWQVLGFPVIVVPGCKDPHTGMPLGLQLVGLPGHEEGLFAAARQLESVLSANGSIESPIGSGKRV